MLASLGQRLAFGLSLSLFPHLLFAAPASFSSSQTQLSALIGHAQNGSVTDLYMHLEAPSDAGWGAIGIGQEMAGSLFFIMYPNQDGNGATVSVRTAGGHMMPQPVEGVEHRVTNSTNVNGRLTADLVCYGCTRWATGSLDTASPSTDWIYAVGPGQRVMSNDNAATIMKHASEGQFTADMASASMPAPDAGDIAPLLAPANSGATTPAAIPTSESDLTMVPSMVTAHATLLCLAFFFFMPVGIILLRTPPVMKTGAAVPLHYSSQGIAWVLAIAGLGIAVNFSRVIPVMLFNEFKSYHQAIGLAATSATIFQGILGLVHHLLFRRIGKRSIITYTHMALGWLVMTLGMLNAPIGFTLVEDIPARNGLIAALVIIFVITVAVSAWGWSFMMKKNKHQHLPEKQLSDSDTRTSNT